TVATITTSGGSVDLSAFLDSAYPDLTLTGITVTNTGNVNLGDVAYDTALTSINAGSSKGGVEVVLDGDTTSFTGGSGGSTVTLVDVTGLAHDISVSGT